MAVNEKADLSRITVVAGQRSGQPCIRGLRVTVWDVLDMLASGMTEDEILADYPYLEKPDFPAVFAYAAAAGRRIFIPNSELWLHTQEASASLDRALEWSAKNPPRESDLDQLESRLKRSKP